MADAKDPKEVVERFDILFLDGVSTGGNIRRCDKLTITQIGVHIYTRGETTVYYPMTAIKMVQTYPVKN